MFPTKLLSVSDLRGLFCNIPWQIIEDYFKSTREFEDGLKFQEMCLQCVSSNIKQIEPHEKMNWTIKLIGLRLNMLDYLNEWDEYISCFDTYIKETDYLLLYAQPKVKKCFNTPLAIASSDPVVADTIKENRFGSFLMSEDLNFLYIHFLFLHSNRYEIIKRKAERLRKGLSVAHLKRHQSDTLTDDEYSDRFDVIMRRIEQYSKDKMYYE